VPGHHRPPKEQPAHPAADEPFDPLRAKQLAAREAGIPKVLNGKLRVQQRVGGDVVKVGAAAAAPGQAGRDQYLELNHEGTDKVLVILAEFGDQRHPDFPDRDTTTDIAGPRRFDGPVHGEIPKPDRAVDNTTNWRADFGPDYYRRLYFGTGRGVESFRTWYERQSSGRYHLDGQVSDWVRLPYNEARYGRSDGFPCAFVLCENTWDMVRDAVNAWLAGQHRMGRDDAQIAAELKPFDVWDRYDHDGDGNFHEPDGYIDHIQIVHAGAGQDANAEQGEDAVISHFGAAFPNNIVGPAGDRAGGVQLGTTPFWVRDYVTVPENAGLGDVVHEYGHDLGLPDLYDAFAPGGGLENPVNWWSQMAQSHVGTAGDQAISTRATDLGPWEKLQLGWLDYDTLRRGRHTIATLGPHEYRSEHPQAILVALPDKPVSTRVDHPPEGVQSWWSGSGDSYDSTLTTSLTLPSTPARLSLAAWWDIETCRPTPCDLATVEVSTGSGYVPLTGTTTGSPRALGFTGSSQGWQRADFDLSRFANQKINIRFHYHTDGSVHGKGLLVDDVSVTAGGRTLLHDGAESGAGKWKSAGFTVVGSTVTEAYDNFYLASYRSYTSFDRYLKNGPYNFSFNPVHPNLVEHFPYQDGLLIWYWDSSFRENNTSRHPGHGMILPIDAHPHLILRSDGKPWRPRVQVYDAPFSLRRSDSFELRDGTLENHIQGQAPNPVFDDRNSYYTEDSSTGMKYGVLIPHSGVRIAVLAAGKGSLRFEISSASAESAN
jgi:immune inhibitor A